MDIKSDGVITGDIVNPRELAVNTRENLYLDTKMFLQEIKNQKRIIGYESFRGDIFQCVITKKEDALNIALMIRAFMKSYTSSEQRAIYNKCPGKGKMVSKGYFPGKQDVRVSIGIGTVDFVKKNS